VNRFSIPPSRPNIVSESQVEVFGKLVSEAIERRRVRASRPAEFYLVNLLTDFIHTRRLYPDSSRHRPTLVELLLQARASGPSAQLSAFRRLGDVALFVAGFFAESLSRSLVDVDYYVAMGGGAYGRASRLAASMASRQIFEELSRRFVAFMDVIGEVGDRSQLAGARNRDLLRIYESFLRTGSERARRRLLEAGVLPLEGLDTRYRQ
jgi:hypothetical protein